MTGQKEELFSKIGYFTDAAEVPISQLQELANKNIFTYTPAGVLYLLATYPDSATYIQEITGVESAVIAERSLQHLTRTQRGMRTGFTVDETTYDLFDQSVRDAGGINKADLSHLVKAFFTMPNAQHTDAYQVLTQLGITQAKINEALSNPPTVGKDRVRELANDATYVETVTATTNMQNVLALLNRNGNARAVVCSEKGSGKHMFLETIARTMLEKRLPGLPQKKMVEINSEFLKSYKPAKKEEKNTNGLLNRILPQNQNQNPKYSDTLYYVDLDALKKEEREKLADLELSAPILAITSKKDTVTTLGDKWNLVPPELYKPYTPAEVNEILVRHQQIEAQNREFTINNEDFQRLSEMFSRYGKTYFPDLSNPGSAVELIRTAAADVSLYGGKVLTPQRLAETIQRLGVNVSTESLTQDLPTKIRRFQELRKKKIIGQDEAGEVIELALARRAAGLSNEGKPIGSFVFLGPTGVGKTETAKVLAEAMFGDRSNMIRIDMSEYQEEHTKMRLVGAPPSYVGYDEGGQLTNAVKKKPCSVVLLDEIDKAHPSVLQTLLQMLDDGRLTDGKGNTVSFNNTVIIMTSNTGARELINAIQRHIPKSQIDEGIIGIFKQTVSPEFFNRIDETIVFNQLNLDNCRQILDMNLQSEVIEALRKNDIAITVDAIARQRLLELGFSPEYGARPLLRVINRQILNPISLGIVNGTLKSKSKLLVTVENNQIVIKNA